MIINYFIKFFFYFYKISFGMCKINKMTICQAQLTSKLLNYFYETSIYNIEEMEMSELLYISICNNSFTYTNVNILN
jgi:hypothetical protein